MGKGKITYVQLANKRTVEIKLHEDGALSIAQVQDGDFIRIPEPFVDNFMDALHTITAQTQQSNSLASALNAAWSSTSMHPRCNSCGVIRSGRKPWFSCDDCGTLTDSDACALKHSQVFGHGKWSDYQ